MLPRFLLDTHVLVRWLIEAKRLSREQLGLIEGAVRRNEPLALSAISLIEIAGLTSLEKLRLRIEEFFCNPIFAPRPAAYL